MCNTKISKPSVPQRSSPMFAIQQRKRNNNGDPEEWSRPAKKVSFSKDEHILGRAQDYDRTSVEPQMPLMRRRQTTVRSRTTVLPAAPAQVSPDDNTIADCERQDQHANFCGRWKRSHGLNWAALLEFSGMNKAAVTEQVNRMRTTSVVHLIDHDAHSFRLVVQNDGGCSTQDQHFFIGSQPRPNLAATPTTSTSETSASSSAAATGTLTSMRWAQKGETLVLSTLDAVSGNEMTVSRRLSSERDRIIQHYTARRAKTGETAEAITIFCRMGSDEGDGASAAAAASVSGDDCTAKAGGTR